MKFKPEIAGAAPDRQTLEQDFSAARSVGKVRLGEQALFFTKFSGTSYLAYDQIVQAYLRQEEVKARLCCGTANFDQFYLMLQCADGRLRRAQLPDKAPGLLCLDHIAAKNPAVKLGFYPSRQV